MKSIARFLLVALAIVPFGAHCGNVPSTRGNNLTAYNGASGATNNNNWNALMNVRSGADAADMPVADFGNCNAIVLRCAQPKCANGGCTSMDIAATIVNGCVQSNDACKQYGDDLVGYIAAQLVANSTAKANAAQAAAANAAAAQSAQQVAAMQQQMQQMQSEMAQQNAETVAQLQSALEEQKQLTAQAIADATAARTTPTTTTTTYTDNSASVETIPGLTVAQQIAAQNGVSPDILAREQITGQIMTNIENAMDSLTTLKTTMEDAFAYAGCDTKGNNCSGPKRVKRFKEKAMDFFDPYKNVLSELYEALVQAQAVGVDITDIYMMLNDSCQVWAQYLCSMGAKAEEHQVCENVTETVEDGKKVTTKQCHYVTATRLTEYDRYNCKNGMSVAGQGNARGGHPCVVGQIIPPEDDIACTLQKMLTSGEEVQRNWLWAEEDDTGANIRVGCMSSALQTSKFFRNMKRGADIDIEVLERIIEQDAPSVYGSTYWGGESTPLTDGVKYCKVNEDTYRDLQKIVSLKTLPTDVCMSDRGMLSAANKGPDFVFSSDLFDNTTSIKTWSDISEEKNACERQTGFGAYWDNGICKCRTGTWNGTRCVSSVETSVEAGTCNVVGGIFINGECDCSAASDKVKCLNYKMSKIKELQANWNLPGVSQNR